MASLPLPSRSPQAFASPAPHAATSMIGVEPPARLSALEWSIVAMAEHDRVSSLREPGAFLSALGSLFGVRRVNRLANDRLEALRRIAVLAWRYRWNVAQSELDQFLDAGFSLDQYELIQTSIGQARMAAAKRRTSR
jgi:hypothetical protein